MVFEGCALSPWGECEGVKCHGNSYESIVNALLEDHGMTSHVIQRAPIGLKTPKEIQSNLLLKNSQMGSFDWSTELIGICSPIGANLEIL